MVHSLLMLYPPPCKFDWLASNRWLTQRLFSPLSDIVKPIALSARYRFEHDALAKDINVWKTDPRVSEEHIVKSEKRVLDLGQKYRSQTREAQAAVTSSFDKFQAHIETRIEEKAVEVIQAVVPKPIDEGALGLRLQSVVEEKVTTIVTEKDIIQEAKFDAKLKELNGRCEAAWDSMNKVREAAFP